MEINNADDLRRAIEADELADQRELAVEGLTKMSVREYAKSKGIQPQLLYYYIRTGRIKEEQCVCGRKVIDVASAETFLSEKALKEKARTTGVGLSGRD